MTQFAVRMADSKYKRVGERLKKKASGSGEKNTKTEISQKKRWGGLTIKEGLG